MSTSKWPNIIGTSVFLHISKLPGSNNFQICLLSTSVQANSTYKAESTPDLFNISSKYHKFSDVFSK